MSFQRFSNVVDLFELSSFTVAVTPSIFQEIREGFGTRNNDAVFEPISGGCRYGLKPSDMFQYCCKDFVVATSSGFLLGFNAAAKILPCLDECPCMVHVYL